MLLLLGGVTRPIQGTSKKGNPYSGVFLQTLWEDATKRGYACESVFVDLLIYDKCLKEYVESDGVFPVLADGGYDPSGHLISLDVLDTRPEDISTFFGLNE